MLALSKQIFNIQKYKRHGKLKNIHKRKWKGGEKEMSKVDKTINALCEWIQEELKADSCTEKSVVTEMVKALADLIASRYQPEQCD